MQADHDFPVSSVADPFLTNIFDIREYRSWREQQEEHKEVNRKTGKQASAND